MAVSVVSTAETAVSTAGTSHLLTMPASIAAGDLVLVTMDIGSTSATVNALAGWTEILDEASANGLKIMWYTGAGVPSAPTFVTSASTRSATIVWRITGADKSITPQIGTTSTGTSLNPAPPASASISVTKGYLFVTFVGMAGEEADDDTWGNTPPTNYLPSPPLQKACGTVGTNLGGLIVAASRVLTTGSTETPGTFNVDVSAAYRAQTVTVHPATWTENRLGTITLVGTKVETNSQTVNRTGTITLTGTRIESKTYTEKVTGTIRLNASTKSLIQSIGPSLYWPLNATDQANDQSASGVNDGTGAGGISIGGYSGSPISGETTSTDFVPNQSITSSYAPFTNGSILTVTGWAYVDSVSGSPVLWGGDHSGYTGPIFYLPNGTTISFGTDGSSGPTYLTWTWGGAGVWFHYALIFDEPGNTATLYLNGALVSAQAQANPYNAAPGNFELGVIFNAQYMDGRQAHVAVFPFALSPNEIGAIYASRLDNLAESFSHTSKPTGTIVLSGTRRESFAGTFTDKRTGTILLTGTRIESKTGTDQRTGTIVLTGTRRESLTFTEKRTGTIVLTGTRRESWSSTTQRTGTIPITGTRRESLTFTEKRSGTIVLSGTRRESETFTEKRSGTIVLTGTIRETYTPPVAGTTNTEKVSGTIVLSGTRIESKTGTEKRTGTIPISGTRRESFAVSEKPSGTIRLAGSVRESWSSIETLSGTVPVLGGMAEIYLPSGLVYHRPTGTIVISGRIKVIHNRWISMGPERWPSDDDSRWEEDAGERWDDSSDARWGDNANTDRWELVP